MHTVTHSKQALKGLRKLQKNIATRIQERMERVAVNPFAADNNVTQMVDRDNVYKLQSGDWRVVYEIKADELVVWVVKVASRQEVYKR